MRKFSSKLRVPVCCLSEVQQLLADQIAQRALDAEPVSDRPACFALLDPDPAEVQLLYCQSDQSPSTAIKVNATAGQIRAILSKRGRYKSEHSANRVKPS